MSSPQTTQQSLSLLLTPDDLKLISEAAAQTHQTETEFVRTAALERANRYKPRVRVSHEELMTLVHAAQEETRRANSTGRDLLQEFLDERRAEAARE